MKVFEEWKQQNYHPETNLVDNDDYKEGYEDGLERGWEEALAWILEFGRKCHYVNDPYDFIQEELDSIPSPKPQSTPTQDQEPPTTP